MDRRTFCLACTAVPLAPAAFAGGHGRLFEFRGINNHTVTGTAEIADGKIYLLDDFRFDGAPDPRIALGNDGAYDPATVGELLTNYSGASTFDLPDGINPEDYNEVWIWCERFSVGLAIASAK